MKKIFSVLLAVMMVFSMSATAFAADFKDTTNIPQSEAIDVIETLGIVNGYGNDVFGPNDTLTRAQLCTMLTRALYGDPIYTSTNQFKDVAPTHWANAYINTAYAYGLMSGYGGGYFGPEDEITYTQMAAVIMKALGYDCGKMSWPTGINSMAHTLGLFDNVKFTDYANGCTRAHAAQMIYNAFDLVFVNHKADYPVQIKGTSFLEDGLGFAKVEGGHNINGHIYEAYENLNDKKADLYVTENRITYEAAIYAVKNSMGHAYRFENSHTSHDIKWFNYNDEKSTGVKLYINNVEIDDGRPLNEYFMDKEAIGIFNDEDELIAVHMESEGVDCIYNVMGDRIYLDEVINDKRYDPDTSTVTYFKESGKYVISNKIDYGWITKAFKSSVYVDGVKVSLTDVVVVGTEELNKGEFVKMFYNYRDEVVAIVSYGTDPYKYDVTDKTYHTFDCDHIEENIDCDVRSYDELLPGSYSFKECKDCHVDEGTLKITIKEEPVKYVTADSWSFYHVESCESVTGNYVEVTDVANCGKEPHTCVK